MTRTWGRRGINGEMVNFLRENAGLAAWGHLLEIGAGKGVFLDRFAKAFSAVGLWLRSNRAESH